MLFCKNMLCYSSPILAISIFKRVNTFSKYRCAIAACIGPAVVLFDKSLPTE